MTARHRELALSEKPGSFPGTNQGHRIPVPVPGHHADGHHDIPSRIVSCAFQKLMRKTPEDGCALLLDLAAKTTQEKRGRIVETWPIASPALPVIDPQGAPMGSHVYGIEISVSPTYIDATLHQTPQFFIESRHVASIKI